MLKTHKIALNPNKNQANLLSQHCGYARVAYNCALSDFKAGLDNGLWRSEMDLRRRFNAHKFEDFDWCKDLSQNASKNAIRNLGDAINRWKGGQNRFPKFKKKSVYKSYQADNGKHTVKVDDHWIYLPKIGKVRMFECLRFQGTVSRVVISKTAHRWFASILVETYDSENLPDIRGFPTIGVDVGIKHLAITSDGRYFENPKPLKRYERKLKRLQRQFSRATKGGSNWYKLKEKIAKLNYRITCIREDFQHKATTIITQGPSAIGIESLNVSGMLKNHSLAKALSDSALSSFLTMLQYKADYLGVDIVEAAPFYPSSKRCSSCGHVDKSLTLSDREYHCGVCGYQIDRDLNAAINLQQLAESCSERINACGETVRPLRKGRFR